MFNFCEVFAGRAMVTDADRANTSRRKIKAPWLQTKVVSRKNRLKISDGKSPLLAQTKQLLDIHGP